LFTGFQRPWVFVHEAAVQKIQTFQAIRVSKR